MLKPRFSIRTLLEIVTLVTVAIGGPFVIVRDRTHSRSQIERLTLDNELLKLNIASLKRRAESDRTAWEDVLHMAGPFSYISMSYADIDSPGSKAVAVFVAETGTVDSFEAQTLVRLGISTISLLDTTVTAEANVILERLYDHEVSDGDHTYRLRQP